MEADGLIPLPIKAVSLKEWEIQASIVEYAKTISADKNLFYIPNEQVIFSLPSPVKWGWWQKLLKMGYKKGAPDLFLAHASAPYHGLFIEVKRNKKEKSRVSKAQLDQHESLKQQGYDVQVVCGITEGCVALANYLGISHTF